MTSKHLLLYRLAELMLQHEQHILPVDLLFDDEQIGDFVKSIQIDSPYQQMIFEGVLTENVLNEKLYVSFTVEGYFHYVLGEVLEDRFSDLTANEIFKYIDSINLTGLNEGFEQFLTRKVDSNEFDLLLWFIDFGDKFTNSTIVPLSHAFLNASKDSTNQAINSIAQSLFETSSDNDIKLLLEIVSKLEKLQKSDILGSILKEVLNFFEPDTPKKALLFVHSVKFLNANEKVDKLEQLTAINFPNYNKEAVLFFQNIGSEWKALGTYNKSILAYKKALNIIDYLKEELIEIRGEINNNLGDALLNDGKLEESQINFEKALEIYIENFGLEHESIGTIYNNLGQLHHEKGDFNEALNYYNKSIYLEEKANGRHHPDTAITYNNIAELFSSNKKYAEARLYFNKAIKVFRNIFGECHEWTATLYNNIAMLDLNLKDFKSSLEHNNKALAILEKLYGIKHPWYATTISNIGGVYQQSGDFENAMVYFQKSLQIKLDIHEDDHPSLGFSYYNIGKCYADLGNFELAKLNYLKVLPIFIKTFGETHSNTLRVKEKLENLSDL
jgi:tetratricopeptide (TPR) repeat protein